MTTTHTGLDVRRIGLTASLDAGTVAQLSAALPAYKTLVLRGDSAEHYTPKAA